MNLVLENEGPQDMPYNLERILSHSFIEDREIWFNFGEAFWPENKKETVQRFMDLPEGSNIICEHNFVDFQQTEFIIGLLEKFKSVGKRVNVYIYNPIMLEELLKFLKERFSSLDRGLIDPENTELRLAFKKVINEQLFGAIEYHKVFQIRRPTFNQNEEYLIQITKEKLVEV